MGLSISVILLTKQAWLLFGVLLRAAFLGGSLFSVESLLHFLGVAFVVELQQALQDFTAGGSLIVKRTPCLVL